MSRSYVSFAVAIAFLIAVVFLLPNIHAYWWKAENATVAFRECSQDECVYKGTLRIEPWTGFYLLELEDGSSIRFEDGSFLYISHPMPGKKHPE